MPRGKKRDRESAGDEESYGSDSAATKKRARHEKQAKAGSKKGSSGGSKTDIVLSRGGMEWS